MASIVETSKMVYINGEIDAASLSSCGIDVTVTSVNHNEQYNPNVGTALVYQNGEILLNEISILAENPTSKTNCFTRTTLKCPFTTIFDIELKENTLDYSIYFTYGS